MDLVSTTVAIPGIRTGEADDDRLRSRVDAMAAITTVELLTGTPAHPHPSVGASYVVLPDVGGYYFVTRYGGLTPAHVTLSEGYEVLFRLPELGALPYGQGHPIRDEILMELAPAPASWDVFLLRETPENASDELGWGAVSGDEFFWLISPRIEPRALALAEVIEQAAARYLKPESLAAEHARFDEALAAGEAVVVDVPRIPAPGENRGWVPAPAGAGDDAAAGDEAADSADAMAGNVHGWVPVDLGAEYESAREFMIVIQDEAGLRWRVAAHLEDLGEDGESAPTYALHIVSDRGACFTGYIGREHDGSWHPEAPAFCRWSPVIPPMLRGADEAPAQVRRLMAEARAILLG